MSFDYVRKTVSGGKARFVDDETAVDLDLVYGTLSHALIVHIVLFCLLRCRAHAVVARNLYDC